MKFLVPAIALFCLAGEAYSHGLPNALGSEQEKLMDFHESYEDPYKHHKRLIRNKGRGPNFRPSNFHEPTDLGEPKNIQNDGHRYYKNRRRSEAEQVVLQTESNNTSEPKKANLTQLFNVDPDLTVLKNLVTERMKMSSPAEEEADTPKRKRPHHGKLAGRAKASCENSNSNFSPSECPSNLENMFVCPKCRTHFVVKINIKESKGCES